jgi:hypothetical protein
VPDFDVIRASKIPLSDRPTKFLVCSNGVLGRFIQTGYAFPSTGIIWPSSRRILLAAERQLEKERNVKEMDFGWIDYWLIACAVFSIFAAIYRQ